MHMTHLPYIVVDVETTGLNPQNGDRVIEGGALKLINNDIVEEFHSLINISEKISIGAQHIHGISRDMLEEWPKAGQVFPRLKTFIGTP